MRNSMIKPKFIITNESITVTLDGKTYNVQKGTPNFEGLEKALKLAKETDNWEDIPNHLTVGTAIRKWSNNDFDITANTVTYKGESLPQGITRRVLDMATRGENSDSILRFWVRLQANPSHRSVTQLWDFLQHSGLPLTKDGYFLAYKGVTDDYKDKHSHTFDNHPGKILEIPRNQVSDDPRTPCHEGFHVGALSYARDFAGRLVVCRVDPADVVCVPHDESSRKMRVCKYEVLGNYGGQLPDSYLDEKEIPEPVLEPDEVVAVPVEPKVVLKDPEKPDKGIKGKESGVEKKMPKAYSKIHEMDHSELMMKSIEDLRSYATHGLFIVGASKIPGGKLALVKRIIKTRINNG